MIDPAAPVKALLEKLKSNRVLYGAVFETNIKINERVFVEGKLTDGTELQYDQDYEVYAYQPPSPRKVSGRGKPYAQWKYPPKNVKGKSAKIKGGYYPNYIAYKDAMARKDRPFDLTGRLQKAWVSAAALVEVSPTVVEVVLTGENAAKYQGLTAKKGAFLAPNADERAYFVERLNAALA